MGRLHCNGSPHNMLSLPQQNGTPSVKSTSQDTKLSSPSENSEIITCELDFAAWIWTLTIRNTDPMVNHSVIETKNNGYWQLCEFIAKDTRRIQHATSNDYFYSHYLWRERNYMDLKCFVTVFFLQKIICKKSPRFNVEIMWWKWGNLHPNMKWHSYLQ
jgi:hypothetical protein